MKLNKIIELIKVIPVLMSGLFLFNSCTQDITIDIPDPESKIVVEGSIEQEIGRASCRERV